MVKGLNTAVLALSLMPLLVVAAERPALVLQDEAEAREFCRESGGDLSKSKFSGEAFVVDLTGDGLDDYVIFNQERWCEGPAAIFGGGSGGMDPLKIIVGTQDGKGRLVYDDGASSAELNKTDTGAELLIGVRGASCGVDVSNLANFEFPSCILKLVWQAEQQAFKEVIQK